jgi:hypothetical protein
MTNKGGQRGRSPVSGLPWVREANLCTEYRYRRDRRRCLQSEETVLFGVSPSVRQWSEAAHKCGQPKKIRVILNSRGNDADDALSFALSIILLRGWLTFAPARCSRLRRGFSFALMLRAQWREDLLRIGADPLLEPAYAGRA